MRNGAATDLEVLIEQIATDEISLGNGKLGIEIPLGGRPGNFEKYYDAKTGWPRANDFGGFALRNAYFTYSQLAALKVVLLQRRAIEKLDDDLQGALGVILQALGEVDPEAEKVYEPMLTEAVY